MTRGRPEFDAVTYHRVKRRRRTTSPIAGKKAATLSAGSRRYRVALDHKRFLTTLGQIIGKSAAMETCACYHDPRLGSAH